MYERTEPSSPGQPLAGTLQTLKRITVKRRLNLDVGVRGVYRFDYLAAENNELRSPKSPRP